MKFILDEEKRGVRVEFADDQDRQTYEMRVDEARQCMANLVRGWEAEPLVCTSMKDVIEMWQNGVRPCPFKEWLRTGMGRPLLICDESERKGGRPLGHRTLVAMFRLLGFAPYELVLEKEKQWRKERYLAKVRDRNVLRAVTSANKRAVRDADMCVARAQRIVESLQAEYLKKHPKEGVYFLIFKSLGGEMTDRGVTKGRTVFSPMRVSKAQL